MSNTRVFDYTEISNIYRSMNQIIGDNSDPSSIAGLLYKIDNDYHEVVNGTAGEDALALYGDLGAQLLLNWENTAGSFPAFVENFGAWSTLVAKAAGDYAAFEQQVKGIRSDNPLGWNSGGIKTGQVASSSYTQTFTDEELDEYAAGVAMYNLVGAYYVDTGMESYVKKNAFWNGFGDVMSVVGIVAGGISIVKGLGIIGSAAKGAGTAAGAAGKVVADQTDEVVTTVGKAAGTAGKEVAGETAEQVGKQTAKEIAGEAAEQAGKQTAKGIAGEAAEQVGKESVKNIDDLVAQTTKMTTKEKVAFIEQLRADGTINNSDDFLKFFGGNQSVAKTAYTAYNGGGGGTTVRAILDGYKSTAAETGKAVLQEGAKTVSGVSTGTVGNVATQSIDDLIASGQPITNGSLYGLTDDVASASDKLVKSGYTLTNDNIWQAPTKINPGNSMFTTPAQKSIYYGKEALKGVGTNVKNGFSNAGNAIKGGLSNAGGAIKGGLSNAGGAIKSGLNTAGNAVKTGATWVYENGVPVLKHTATNLGTAGWVGQTANIGQNMINNSQAARTAEMIASAQEHFGNNNGN